MCSRLCRSIEPSERAGGRARMLQQSFFQDKDSASLTPRPHPLHTAHLRPFSVPHAADPRGICATPHRRVRFSAPAHPQRIWAAKLPALRLPGTAAAQVVSSHRPRTIEMPTAVHRRRQRLSLGESNVGHNARWGSMIVGAPRITCTALASSLPRYDAE